MKYFQYVLAALLFLPGVAGAETITVGTIDRAPFSMENSNGKWHGFSPALLDEIAKRAGHELVYQPYAVFSQLLLDVENGAVDLGAANISVTADREAVMDFSQPIFDSGLQIIVPADQSNKSIVTVIWESGLILFLGGALLVLLVVAHLVWFFERGIKDARHDYFRDDYMGGIFDAFWWCFVIVTMGGFENERPHHYMGRVLAIFWVASSLFFVSLLTAQITTALTVAELSTDIESLQDLHGKKVGAPIGTTIATFLDEQNIAFEAYDDFSEVLQAVERGELDAAVGDAPVVQYYASTKGKDKVLVVGEVFAPDSISLAFPEDSPYFEEFNGILLQLKHDGTYARLFEKYFGN